MYNIVCSLVDISIDIHAHTQALLVNLSLDLNLYHSVLDYWTTRCLLSRSPGVLTLLGLVQVQDLIYYLQYYSLPVLTAILTPFIRVFLALKSVYSVQTPELNYK